MSQQLNRLTCITPSRGFTQGKEYSIEQRPGSGPGPTDVVCLRNDLGEDRCVPRVNFSTTPMLCIDGTAHVVAGVPYDVQPTEDPSFYAVKVGTRWRCLYTSRFVAPKGYDTPAPTPEVPPPTPAVKGFDSLRVVLDAAFEQAAVGKGQQRHGGGKPFDEQPMQDLINLYGPGFALGQAAKKMQEALRLEGNEAKERELLGAINYIAGYIVYLKGTK